VETKGEKIMRSLKTGDLVKRHNFGWLGIVVETTDKTTVVCWLNRNICKEDTLVRTKYCKDDDILLPVNHSTNHSP